MIPSPTRKDSLDFKASYKRSSIQSFRCIHRELSPIFFRQTDRKKESARTRSNSLRASRQTRGVDYHGDRSVASSEGSTSIFRVDRLALNKCSPDSNQSIERIRTRENRFGQKIFRRSIFLSQAKEEPIDKCLVRNHFSLSPLIFE